jgi:hypothetical protein
MWLLPFALAITCAFANVVRVGLHALTLGYSDNYETLLESLQIATLKIVTFCVDYVSAFLILGYVWSKIGVNPEIWLSLTGFRFNEPLAILLIQAWCAFWLVDGSLMHIAVAQFGITLDNEELPGFGSIILNLFIVVGPFLFFRL